MHHSYLFGIDSQVFLFKCAHSLILHNCQPYKNQILLFNFICFLFCWRTVVPNFYLFFCMWIFLSHLKNKCKMYDCIWWSFIVFFSFYRSIVVLFFEVKKCINHSYIGSTEQGFFLNQILLVDRGSFKVEAVYVWLYYSCFVVIQYFIKSVYQIIRQILIAFKLFFTWVTQDQHFVICNMIKCSTVHLLICKFNCKHIFVLKSQYVFMYILFNQVSQRFYPLDCFM